MPPIVAFVVPVACAAALLGAALFHSSRARSLVGVGFFVVAATTSAAAWWLRPRTVLESKVEGRPIQQPKAGYVSSSECRPCHQHQYDTWHDTYHRTMTQVATPETVLGDFDDVHLTVDGRELHLQQRGDELWVTMDDPLAVEQGRPAGRVDRRVVMTTGSHNMQVYWFASGFTRVIGTLPLAWQVVEQRWIPRNAAFVRDPDLPVLHDLSSWNFVCIKCHATGAHPRVEYERNQIVAADTHVGEFGIACEACHGPGAEHVAANRNPLRRYSLHVSGDPDTTIVEPTTLDHVRSTQVCGQCHGQFDYQFDMSRMNKFFATGFEYRPGDDVLARRKLKFEGDTQFWSDGLVRVAGREYNSMVGSGCFDEGELACTTCHVMHQPQGDSRPREEWANDMLRAESLDSTCLKCHPSFEDDFPAHTHHAADSEGSRCANCHMPHTTYGLMKGVRTHRIASPSVQSSVDTGRPNACNQCHLDRSLGWTANHMQAWYGTPRPKLTQDQERVAASVLWTLEGDAAQRALMAWSLGWETAQEASGNDWIAPYLGELLVDPYPAVRIIAERSLRNLPGQLPLEYDLLGERELREAARIRVLEAWRRRSPDRRDDAREAVLLRPDGTLDLEAFARHLGRRNHRKIILAE